MLKKFLVPTEEQTAEFWNEASPDMRLHYSKEAFDTEYEEDNKVVLFISQQKWNDIPDVIREVIDGESQLANDVFDKINEKVEF